MCRDHFYGSLITSSTLFTICDILKSSIIGESGNWTFNGFTGHLRTIVTNWTFIGQIIC